MCQFILLMAFMVLNPFGFPMWVIYLAWIGLVGDVLLGLWNLIWGKSNG